MGKSLVLLDTDRIHSYVFSTDTLREIRGASALLDKLNRQEMQQVARALDSKAETIFANGGSGLFRIDSAQAEQFAQHVTRRYRELTAGGASVTWVKQDLPGKGTQDDIGKLWKLLNYRLRLEKGHPAPLLALPSHPFMRPCDACGRFYAQGEGRENEQDDATLERRYCQSCLDKRDEDRDIKKSIDAIVQHKTAEHKTEASLLAMPLWERIVRKLKDADYKMDNLDRPQSVNDFAAFKPSDSYIGLIYADANGMGQQMRELTLLSKIKKSAIETDQAVDSAVCQAIQQHLRLEQHERYDGKEGWIFPFDILLMGGDDVLLLTPASAALHAACTLARAFYRAADGEQAERSFSIGVLLAPLKYPFGQLLELAEETLKFAKQDGAKLQQGKQASRFGKTRINFMVVTGSTSQSFKRVYDSLHRASNGDGAPSFAATMRPYTLEQLEKLLTTIAEGKRLGLGRTRLHQLRAAILAQNESTSIVEGLSVLRNWKDEQRDFILQQARTLHMYVDDAQLSIKDPAALFPRVTFPWFVTDKKRENYCTTLLDFVELYDFVHVAKKEQQQS